MTAGTPVVPGARLSPGRTWRYTLFRLTEHALHEVTVTEGAPLHRRVVFVGLNPSTADEVVNDSTVRRCLGFAARWRFEEMMMLNVFAFRATNPSKLARLSREDAVGPENDYWIAVECASADLVVCCWGVHGDHWGRGREVAESLDGINVPLHVFGLTKGGHPKHPLYLRGGLKPEPWAGYS